MTKPQFAPEPSMEDILASIRKMISDDRSGPRPLPDQMARTPFAETSAPAPVEASGRRAAGPEATPATRPGSNFGSLSEAIKAAAQPAEQRRTLEERISDLLEKGSGGSAEPLASFAGRARPAAAEPAAPSRTAAPAEPTQRGSQDIPSRGAGSSAALPFGTRAPASPVASPAAVTPAKAAPSEPKADAQRVIAMPSRYPASPAASASAPAANGAALNGQGHGTAVGSFGSRVAANGTQPVHETPASTDDFARTKEPGSPDARTDAPSMQSATPHASEPAPAEVVAAALGEIAPATTAAAPSEALVDAMVELVRKEPASLSVFTSGAAFIGGVSSKGIGVEKSVAAHKKGASTVPAAAAPPADDSVPELDGAAAELLRPMLRQWLAENMPRIVEAALRSEVTSGGKGPGKV